MSDDTAATEAPASATPVPQASGLSQPPAREVLHRETWLKAGRGKSVAEVWAEGLPAHARCLHCRTPRAGVKVWIRTYCPVGDFARAVGPQGVAEYAKKHGGQLPILPTVAGPMVFLREVFACASCAPSAERAAAEHPSYYLVEVRKAPDHRPQVAVPRGRGA